MRYLYTISLILAFVVFSTNINAQNDQKQDLGSDFFKIVNVGNDYSESDITTAMMKANWCGYHYVNDNRKLTFDDGSVIELISAGKLQKTYRFDMNCAQIVSDKKTKDQHEKIIYSIHSSGGILMDIPMLDDPKHN